MAAENSRQSADIPDEEIVQRLCEGDSTAFELVYERYFERIYQFVNRRLRNRADTEETVQEVFINIFSSIRSFRGDACFAAWVFGLTRRTIAARFKKKRHATVPLDEGQQEHAPFSDPTPLEAYECRERLARLENAVTTRLSTDQRTLFRLHHLENRTISEIAHRLHKSENAVKSNLYRARKILLAR